MKTLFAILVTGMICSFVDAQDKKELQTEITQVTVFSIGAQIHRSGILNLSEGKNVVIIKGLPPEIDPNSIQVKGNDDYTIQSVKHNWNTSAASVNNKAIDSLNENNKKLDWIVRTLHMRDNVLNDKLNLLNQNSQIGNKTSGTTVEQLEKALLLFESTMMTAQQEKLLIAQQLDSLEKVKVETTTKINSLRGTPLISKSEIEISILTDLPKQSQFEISYIVKNAGWIPGYDIRAKDASQPIIVEYKASIHQQTGEVWKNVKLTLSNASPYGRQTAPELEQWRLTTLKHTTFRRINSAELDFGMRNINGCVKDQNGESLIYANVYVEGHNLGTQTDLDGNFSLIVPHDATSVFVSYTGYETKSVPVSSNYLKITLEEGIQLNSAVVTGYAQSGEKRDIAYSASSAVQNRSSKSIPESVIVIDNQVSVEFELKNKATILSDGQNATLEVQTYEIAADYRYETTPKLDVGAYLIATITNWEKYHLLEGQANLYFNNTFIGKTVLDPLNLSDTLEISLGRDPEVLVERVKDEEFTKKTFLGTNTIIEKNIKLSFRNKKQYPVHIQVTDQVPVSINDDITVTATQISGGEQSDSSGIIKWDFHIEPVSNKDLLLSYTVKYPSKERVALE